MAGFTINSNQFTGQVPEECLFDGMGVGGQNRSPQLMWQDAPSDTKSFIIILHDPDAPTPAGFTHWCAFNIPGEVTTLATGASTDGMPEGTIQCANSLGNYRYDGSAPPPGDADHAYNLTIYALDTVLELTGATPPPKVIFMAQANILARAGLVAYYGR